MYYDRSRVTAVTAQQTAQHGFSKTYSKCKDAREIISITTSKPVRVIHLKFLFLLEQAKQLCLELVVALREPNLSHRRHPLCVRVRIAHKQRDRDHASKRKRKRKRGRGREGERSACMRGGRNRANALSSAQAFMASEAVC